MSALKFDRDGWFWRYLHRYHKLNRTMGNPKDACRMGQLFVSVMIHDVVRSFLILFIGITSFVALLTLVGVVHAITVTPFHDVVLYPLSVLEEAGNCVLFIANSVGTPLFEVNQVVGITISLLLAPSILVFFAIGMLLMILYWTSFIWIPTVLVYSYLIIRSVLRNEDYEKTRNDFLNNISSVVANNKGEPRVYIKPFVAVGDALCLTGWSIYSAFKKICLPVETYDSNQKEHNFD